MLLVDHLPEPLARESLAGRERDTLEARWEERRWTRRRTRTAHGRELALALPTGSVLEPGTLLAVGADFYVEVEALAEPVLAVVPRSPREAIRLAFEVGNRHFPLALDGERLLVPDDSALRQLLERLGVAFERTEAVFTPIGGGHRHEPGTSPTDGHTHAAGDAAHDQGGTGHDHGGGNGS
jgi:urease accessory protein